MGTRSLARKIHDEPTMTTATTVTHGSTGTCLVAVPCVVYGIYASPVITAAKYLYLYDQITTTAVAGNLKATLAHTVTTDHIFPNGMVFNTGLTVLEDDSSIDLAKIQVLYSKI